jgi:hypothetical protein
MLGYIYIYVLQDGPSYANNFDKSRWKLNRLKSYRNALHCYCNVKLFGPKRDEITGGWRKLHNEELHCTLRQSIIRMNKSRRMRWAEHVTSRGIRRERDLDVGGRIELECILEK